MRSDFSNWNPYSLEQIKVLFSAADFKWGIAGGWAIDLYIERQTRQHEDMDILILSSEQQNLFNYLKSFTVYVAKDGKLSIWSGQKIDDSCSLWVSEHQSTPFIFEILLMDIVEDKWIYKRDRKINGELNSLFIESKYDVKIVAPEVQLLYKLGASSIRDKDIQDLKAVYKFLDASQLEWLEASLNAQFLIETTDKYDIDWG
ncbi:nucleotidyltransferase domain-containing protein [Macrococcus brunensis]|uniref:nucleotidyltransferase domain-containing protein n=1 Tax=Macrococcus brunensis TaxID=198483 RepID=UPI001EEFE4B7|nr:hypothetical protein [Macrococcus brunensis]ULG72297.1 hypothetical protein MGG12_01870 [Macrococcus brunensis]